MKAIPFSSKSPIKLSTHENFDFNYYNLEDFEKVKLLYAQTDVCFILIREIKGFVLHINDYGFTFNIDKLNINLWINPNYHPIVNKIGILILNGTNTLNLIDAIHHYQAVYCK